MPLRVALTSSDPDRSSLPTRVVVQPLESSLLHQMGAFHHLDKVALEPLSYGLSPEMGVPHGPSTRSGYALVQPWILQHCDLTSFGRFLSDNTGVGPCCNRCLGWCRSDYLGMEVMGKASVQVRKERREDGSASLSLCHCYDPASGAHTLRVSCSLWVFNCTGLPIALRQSWLLETFTNQVCPDPWLTLPVLSEAELRAHPKQGISTATGYCWQLTLTSLSKCS